MEFTLNNNNIMNKRKKIDRVKNMFEKKRRYFVISKGADVSIDQALMQFDEQKIYAHLCNANIFFIYTRFCCY